jgi:MoCo/4Fe-4S cofactor protein with predicted Tat translocation signal
MNPQNPSARQFWRSLEEREDPSLGFHDEFMPGTSEPPGSVSRRHFLGLLGATAALATVAGCDRRTRNLVVPYTKRPETGVPGVADYYASCHQEGRRSYSVLVKTREGRPIHITGNDEPPLAKGTTSPRTIAEVLSLYDPDRLRGPKIEGQPASWEAVQDRLFKALAQAKASGQRVLLVTDAVLSPTRKALIQEFKAQLPSLEHLAWEPLASATDAASTLAFGSPCTTILQLQKAEAILSVGADFLNGEDPAAIAAFAALRKPDPLAMTARNRLWVFEGPLSLTGARADHRFPLPSSKAAALVFTLARELHEKHGLPLPADTKLPTLPPESLGIPSSIWNFLLADLVRCGKRSVVLAGPELPLEAQLGIYLLNTMLGSEALDYQPTEALAGHRDLEKAVQAKPAVVLFWGVNPAYAFPAQETFRAALEQIPLRAWIGLREDETASRCQLQLPAHHWLEAWGDYAEPGLLFLQQPASGVLYDTRQGEDILLDLARRLGAPGSGDYHAFLKTRWEQEVQPKGSLVPFERYFQAALHDGLVRTLEAQAAAPFFKAHALKDLQLASGSGKGFELVLHPGRTVFDGRHGNNGWLQELPDPVTKNTWGNPLSLSVTDARELGVKDGDLVELRVHPRRLQLPVLVQPGQARGVLALALGYGQTTGSVARGVGVNAFPLLSMDPRNPSVRPEVSLSKSGGHRELPITQGHHRMEGRDIVRSTTLAQLARGALPARDTQDLPTLYPPPSPSEHQWGMAIDLSTCVGCSGCVVACQSENNGPIVGPEQVAKGREMHWIRIDRYYEGEPENPQVVHQPMMCQQCGHAPCENVCPVNATTHSPDGLNQMTYNRCVGTKYCANNCPYKVRRFNFLEFTATKHEPESLVYNPEVTVRPRGVMEKCTFCVQRIQDGRMRARSENRPLKDGEIVPACAAACPSQAIVFGDLKDPDSRVSKLARSGRGYQVLEELGVRPAVTYLTDVRNPAGDGHAS